MISFGKSSRMSNDVAESTRKKKKKQDQRKTLTCTACALGRDAEQRHPVLHVPICGACNLTFKQRDKGIEDGNEESCVWCGRGDDMHLIKCDTCVFAFCEDCIVRNLGRAEAERLIDPSFKEWSCYHCSPFPLFESIKAPENMIFYSIDQAYAAVHPPEESLLEFEAISNWEYNRRVTNDLGAIKLASIFCDRVSNLPPECGKEIASYLTAPDVGVLFAVNKPLREFFLANACILPGLFQTSIGRERRYKLFRHQSVSLQLMRMMEHKTTTFGALRGGILADEPGLGKTATVLALICSSIGKKPRIPEINWDYDDIEHNWSLCSDKDAAMARVLKLLDNKVPSYQLLKKDLKRGEDSFADIYLKIRRIVGEYSLPSFSRERILASVAFEMNKIKANFDRKSRKALTNVNNRRFKLECSLYSSCATLVIVPQELLEYWREQILMHLNLFYFSRDHHCARGVAYFHGIGDIMDFNGPYDSAVHRAEPSLLISDMANYSIVVTTLELCASEYRKYCNDKLSSIEDSAMKGSPLHGIRWLRLVIDEGHDIGRSNSSASNAAAHKQRPNATVNLQEISAQERARANKRLQQLSAASNFILEIAAERRWIMSGTPTTGAHSDIGLEQLFHLLCFLRHPWAVYPQDSQQKISSYFNWKHNVIIPCLEQDPLSWGAVTTLLKSLMIRHSKESAKLFDPVESTWNLLAEPRPGDAVLNPDDPRAVAIDRAKAIHIASTMLQGKEAWLKNPIGVRRPKGIIYSQYEGELQGVGNILISELLGDSGVCEHFGKYASSELSRFRHSKKLHQVCPLCGFHNSIVSKGYCQRRLLLVEYLDMEDLEPPEPHSPNPAGHGATGWGHFLGRCLCSPLGCPSDVPCRGYINPLNPAFDPLFSNPNLALVQEEDLNNYTVGMHVQINEVVFVTPAASDPTLPFLRAGGRRGGQAVVRQYRACSGASKHSSWFGPRVLDAVPWQVQDEDAFVMMLQYEGSHGLDLSFVTHLFLLERINDPALRNQIISRAHRVGATGPVHVHLLLTVAEGDEDHCRVIRKGKADERIIDLVPA